MSDMRRRDFITLVGGAIASWPQTARAQQRPKIGLLDTGLGAAFAVPFMGKLAELGYVEGENICRFRFILLSPRLKFLPTGYLSERVKKVIPYLFFFFSEDFR